MTKTVRPGAVLKRGVAGLPPDILKFLVENEAEVEKLYAGSARSPGRRPRERRFATPYNTGKLIVNQGVTHPKSAEIWVLHGITYFTGSTTGST